MFIFSVGDGVDKGIDLIREVRQGSRRANELTGRGGYFEDAIDATLEQATTTRRDGADLLGQLYNRATGQQIDPVIAVLASAGLILDATTGGVGDVTAILKGGYKLSLDLAEQGVGGVLAVTVRTQVEGVLSGAVSARQFVDTTAERFGAVVRLGTTPGCGFFGSSCIPRYDRIARSIADTNSVDASPALTNLDEIYLKDAKLDVAETNYKDRIDDLDASSTCFLRSLGSTNFSIEVLANPCPLTFDREPSSIPGLPRVTRVRADLNNSFIGTSPTKAARNFVRQYGKPGDDAGHIVARVLGGQGGVSSDNIVPVASSINRGPMATLEGELKRALQDQRSVSVDIRLEYDDPAMPLRPTRIIYNYTIDGDPDTRTFTQ